MRYYLTLINKTYSNHLESELLILILSNFSPIGEGKKSKIHPHPSIVSIV